MILSRGKLRLRWCVSGMCLIMVFSYFFHPVFYFGRPQTNEEHLKTEQMVKDDLLTLNRPDVNDLFVKSMLNLPEWYRSKDWGLKKNNVSLETKGYPNELLGLDNEVNITWNNFFYGTTKGLILELGAVDGKLISVSKFYESEAGWRSILVEGNPDLGSILQKNRPNALNFNTAICENPKTVHYVKRGPLGGILEFMDPGFLKRFYSNLLTNGKLDEKKVAEKAVKLPCVPLTHILYPLKIYHINFFMLDVEGAELSVLKAIDFGKIKFDVIGVETDRGTDSEDVTKDYVDSVIQFLLSKGYELWSRKMGRNSWFKHPDFVGFSKN